MTYQEIITVPLSYDDVVQKLRDHERFDFSRYGDGELECMFHKRGRPMNSDLHKYYPDLGQALIDVWKNWKNAPGYYLGLQNLGFRQNKEIVIDYTNRYNIKWSGSDIFHKASMRGRIQEIIDVLNEREVLLVGNKYLKALGWHQVEVPLENAWLAFDEIVEYVEENIKPDMVVVYACGMQASVLIDKFAGIATQVDIGSAFDPYCGYMSRGYHFELPVERGESSKYFKQRGK